MSTNQRFIIAPTELMIETDEKLVILSDYKYWAEHIDELTQWCSERDATNSGMVVVFGDDVTMLEFVLRWS